MSRAAGIIGIGMFLRRVGSPAGVLTLDASSASVGDIAPRTTTWTHTPSGTPTGCIIGVAKNNSSGSASAVKYGTANLSRVTGAPWEKLTGTDFEVDWWIAESGIPSGAQTCSVTLDGNALHQCVCYTFVSTSNAIAFVATDGISSDSVQSPSATFNRNSTTSFLAQAFCTGLNNAGWYAPWSGWTSTIEYAPGASRSMGFYKYDTIDSANVTYGYNHNAGDGAANSLIRVIQIKAA
jgi:hypothetical protein